MALHLIQLGAPDVNLILRQDIEAARGMPHSAAAVDSSAPLQDCPDRTSSGVHEPSPEPPRRSGQPAHQFENRVPSPQHQHDAAAAVGAGAHRAGCFGSVGSFVISTLDRPVSLCDHSQGLRKLNSILPRRRSVTSASTRTPCVLLWNSALTWARSPCGHSRRSV